ncbi:hypothetical protein CBS101457_003058 [Exobasidium rhododendri]|nr:hypothetical protein CBS101457_003058 [Exobasidium rhododendri]
MTIDTSPLIYLVTGANRGIGQAIVKTLLLKENSHVIGTVRDLKSPYVHKLRELAVAKGSKLSLVAMEVSEPESIVKAVSGLDVPRLDIIIANAGISRPAKSVAEVDIEEMNAHFKVNTLGPLVLYQATKQLLEKSKNPKVIFISTMAASVAIQASFPFNNTPYSVSKAGLNTIGAKLAYEEKDKMIVLMLHPGVVNTDMVDEQAWKDVDLVTLMKEAGIKMISTQESADQILKIVTEAKHEDSGKFLDSSNNSIIPW